MEIAFIKVRIIFLDYDFLYLFASIKVKILLQLDRPLVAIKDNH